MGVVLDEADEADGWLGAACELDLGDLTEAGALKKEAEELCAIFGRSCQTARRPMAGLLGSMYRSAMSRYGANTANSSHPLPSAPS